MRVALCDDSALFRGGLAALLRAADVDVVHESATVENLIEHLDGVAAPDVAVLDIRMPPTFTDEGIRGAAEIRRRHRSVGILVLSTYAEAAYAVTLMEECGTGGVGYLIKDRVQDVPTLLEALDRTAHGEVVIDPDIVRRLVDRNRRLSALDRLTPREREVLEQMALGRSNVGIARVLHMSVKTVERHIAHLLAQLDLAADTGDNRRVLAVMTWLRSGNHA